jgi:hypothetical protein
VIVCCPFWPEYDSPTSGGERASRRSAKILIGKLGKKQKFNHLISHGAPML